MIGRLLGVEVRPELVPREENPERSPGAVLSAAGGIEAIARRRRS